MKRVKMISANAVEYRGFVGSMNYDQKSNLYYGSVTAGGTLIEYSGRTVYDFNESFASGIDDYLL